MTSREKCQKEKLEEKKVLPQKSHIIGNESTMGNRPDDSFYQGRLLSLYKWAR